MSAARPLPWEDDPAGETPVLPPVPPRGLHPAQQRVFDNLSRFSVIAAGRRFGKTFFSVKLACYWARLSHDAKGARPKGR